ncbi:DUF6364 family protein [Leptospira alexanderi]|nr:DUF6364 family protein [Leptospira alexanderi]
MRPSSKLTLSIEKTVIEKAKKYAQKRHKSLSNVSRVVRKFGRIRN